MFAAGLLLSSNPNTTGDLVQVPSMLFQGSLLLGLISRATLGYAYVLPLPLCIIKAKILFACELRGFPFDSIIIFIVDMVLY